MKYVIIIMLLASVAPPSAAQKADRYLYKGNELYKKKEYEKSLEQYKQAVSQEPKNPVASFNQGAAQFRQLQHGQSEQSFNNVLENATDKATQQQALYNKGVAQVKQNKLEESIESWKEALKLNPNDQLARENLQRALRELKKKQEEQKQQQQQQKKDKKQKQQEKEKQQQQQPPPQSRLSKQRVEQLLKALQQKEREVQQRLQKEKVSPRKPEKDW
ncbi:MAG TPA: tetratricopeptide repeat protein [Chitinophagaceae bacterium]|nr:tetratricopeptide repeat protein [Chitinophagaceae bacterium]